MQKTKQCKNKTMKKTIQSKKNNAKITKQQKITKKCKNKTIQKTK